MRKFEFRAWTGKDMVEPDFINSEGTCYETYRGYDGDIPIKAGSFILMQYTGLKDKNNKEIYESDLCKTFNSRIGEVKFGLFEDCESDHSLEACGWYLDIPEYGQVGLDSGTERWCEVIGNKYEEVKE